MHNINKRMASGIVWMVAARLLDRSIGIVSTLILARLLVPADFGLIAMATAIGGVLDLMGAFSFDLALIQKSNAEPRHYNTVWTFNVIFGVTCGLIMIALAGPAAVFYREPRLTDVIYVLSISYFINAFSNVGVVNFRKDLDFKNEFIFVFARRFIMFTLTIGAAFVLRSYWALLLGMTAGRIVGVVLSYTMNTYRPRFTLSAAKELFLFSKWLLLNNVLFFIVHDGCTFVIGRLFGATELGIYSVAYEISSLPSTELVAPINRVTFPGFSKMSVTDMSLAYLKLIGMVSIIIVPVGVGIAAVAGALVLTALGTKWIDAVPLIQILAIHGALAATQGNNGTVWLALGNPRVLTGSVVLFLLVLFPALYLFMSRLGVTGAGYAYLAANFATIPYGLYVTQKMLGFRLRALLQVVWRPWAAAAVMYAGVAALHSRVQAFSPIAQLVCESLLGATIFIVSVLALWTLTGRPPGAERFCLDRVTDFIAKLGLKASTN